MYNIAKMIQLKICTCGKLAKANLCRSCQKMCSCGRVAVYGKNNCSSCPDPDFEEGTCCFCGNPCNPSSQSCGRCPRNLFFTGEWN